MRWTLAALALVLVGVAMPAVGSFHETMGIVPDRIYPLAMQGTSFNGLHAPQAPLLEAYLGERARFVLAASEAHTFHLHGHPWLTNGAVIDTFLVDPDTPHVFDVIAGGVDRHAGDWMYHCHVDDHMAEGMWGIFRVYPFLTTIEEAGHTLVVTAERLGVPLDGAYVTLAVDGVAVPSHAVDAGEGVYVVHAELPASGVVVATITHPEEGVSVARLALGDAELPLPTLAAHH